MCAIIVIWTVWVVTIPVLVRHVTITLFPQQNKQEAGGCGLVVSKKKLKNVDAKWNVACLIFSADVHIISVKSHLTTTEESNRTTLQGCSCAFCQNSIVMCKTFFVKWNKTSTVPLHVDRHVCFCALWFLVSGETVSVVCCVILIRVKIFKRNCLLVYCMTRQQTLKSM